MALTDGISTTQTINCSACKQDFPLKQNTAGRQLPGYEGQVLQYGITCPHCEAYTHAFFETPALVTERNKMNAAQHKFQVAHASRKDATWKAYQTAKETFNRAFRKEQIHWRKKLHMGQPVATATGEVA